MHSRLLVSLVAADSSDLYPKKLDFNLAQTASSGTVDKLSLQATSTPQNLSLANYSSVAHIVIYNPSAYEVDISHNSQQVYVPAGSVIILSNVAVGSNFTYSRGESTDSAFEIYIVGVRA